MVRIILLMGFMQAFLFGEGQNDSLTDGPYLFYKSDSLFIESVDNGVCKKESLKLQHKHSQLFSVTVPGQPGLFFSVPLKASLNNEDESYKSVDKLFVLSDIEGTFQGLYKMLLTGNVIDNKFNWTFGNGHLVICGDMFDRGDEVVACLWLLYKLEDEAKAMGGYVHVILGNHDIMNLSEDLRYLHPKYLQVAALMKRNYSELYTNNTELGRWLRSKNIMERIGDLLFLHAGVSKTVNETGLSLKEINNQVRPYYDKSGYDSLLIQAKVLPFFSDDSPFWYRGYFINPKASQTQVNSTLEIFNVKKIIVGHDIVDRMKTLYDSKVIAIDVNYHSGNYQALVIDRERFYCMNAEGQIRELQ